MLMFWSMAAKNRKMSAITSAVKLALSNRKAEFVNEIHRIEGKANERGGGVAKLSSGTFLKDFVDAIEAEHRNRSHIAKEALGQAVESQKLKVRQKTVTQLKKSIREVWTEGIQDLRDWYQKRVLSANEKIAEERPFESSAEAALKGVFVDIGNKAWEPGFWGKNKDRIWLILISGIIVTVLGLISTLLYQYLFPGNGSH